MVVRVEDDVLELYVGCGHPALAEAMGETALALAPVTEPPAALSDLTWVYRVVDGTAPVRGLHEECWADAAAFTSVMGGNPRAFAALRAICAVAMDHPPARLLARAEEGDASVPLAKPLALARIVPGEGLFSGLYGGVLTSLYTLEAGE